MKNKIVHIGLRVPSFDEANDLLDMLFESEKLIERESKIYPGPPWFIALNQLDGVLIEIIGIKGESTGESWGLDHIAFETDSFDEVMNYLADKNAEFSNSHTNAKRQRSTFAFLKNGLCFEVIESES